MSRSTRRELVGASAGTVALAATWPALAGAAAAPPARCEVRRPAVRRTAVVLSPDGRTAWTADATTAALTAHDARDATPRAEVPLPAPPLDLALLDGGRQAVVVLEGGEVAVVDLRTRAVVARHDLGTLPKAVAADPAGRAAVVVGGGNEGWLRRLDPATGAPLARAPLAIGAHPRSVAFAGRARVVVACNTAAAVEVVDLARGAVRTIATGPYPAHVAVAPGGRRAWVSHDGYRARQVTPLDLGALRAGRPWRTGTDPGGVAVLQRGRTVAVAERAAGHLALYDAATGRRRRRIAVGGSPRGIATARGRTVVVDDETGRLTAVAA